MKASRLLLRLDASISHAKQQLDADCFLAEKAVYLARLRAGDEATKIIKQLHRQYDRKPNVVISIWLNLAEGLKIYFSDMGASANDKVRRAHALSVAAGIDPLRAISAAWLAQLDYMRHDIEAMANHLDETLRLAESNHHAARSRAGLVIAQALHHAGRFDLALEWHEKARLHALQEGDDATVSALIHNMAWLRMLTWRQSVLTGRSDRSSGQHALMGAESTIQFDELVGSSTLPELQPLLKAQIFSLRGDFSQAVDLYQRYLIDAAGPESVSRMECNLLSDLAWCHAKLNNLDKALEYATIAESSLTPETHIDDRAATHGALANVFASLGNVDASSRHEQLSSEAWRHNAALQARVVELLEPMSDTGAVPR